MLARAPGKVVWTGAYSVLRGSLALVSAVDRYVIADSTRSARFTTEEVLAAHLDPAPFFDASALRQDNQKLGLGSSAAILVASMAVRLMEREPLVSPEKLPQRLFLPALNAHRTAQGGGSGIDVAASCFGGTLLCKMDPDGQLELHPCALPQGLELALFHAPMAAKTRHMLEAVFALELSRPREFRDLLMAQADASNRAASMCQTANVQGLLAAIAQQFEALNALGRAARVPIVTPEVNTLNALARASGGVMLPAGAGGGDIALFLGNRPPKEALLRRATKLGYQRILARMQAKGVHLVRSEVLGEDIQKVDDGG